MLPFMQHQKRIKVAVGGRGSAKSTGVSDMLVAQMYDGAVICGGREQLNSIEESVHGSLKDSIERLGLEGFDIQKATISHSSGGRSFYKGLSRNPSAIKSITGIDFFWGEEAQTLSQESLDMLFPTIRKSAGQSRMPELWFTANRQASKDPFSQKLLVPYEQYLLSQGFYEDDLRLIVEINYRDNPWFHLSGLEDERLSDKQTMSTAKYEWIWEGAYNDEVEDSIISSEWFDACVDAHIKLGFNPEGAEIVAFDPSDTGDAKGLCYRHGSVVKNVQQYEQGDINQGCDWALDYAIQNQVDVFTWDCDGLGIGLKRQIGDALAGKKISLQQFKGSHGAELPDAIYQPSDKDVEETSKPKTNKETFKNQRAQFYIALRDRVYRTYLAVTAGKYFDPDEMISFSSEIEDMRTLRSEICRIPQKPNGNGKIQIMRKDEMKRLNISSPNMADAVMMSMKFSPTKPALEPVPCSDAPAFM